MDLATFLNERRPEWRQLEGLLEQVEGSGLGSLDDEQAVAFGRLYRRTASDLNHAQTFINGEATVRYLNDLVARCYLVIYAVPRRSFLGVLRPLFWDYPAVFRRYFGHFLLATAIFAAGAVFGLLASYFHPVSRLYLLPDMPMIQPGEKSTMPLQTSDELAGFSSFLFTHNVQVTLVAFAAGITFGVGSAWLMFYNGLSMGALGAIFLEANQGLAFATGVLPHGVLEIPAMLLGGASGLMLGQALIQARPWSRIDELIRRSADALFLVWGCVPLLAVAALLEAGVARAPDWFFGSSLKLLVAGVFGFLFVAYVLLLGWGKRGRAEGVAK
jgi:uncharacterized membrane protein SpoIIM required for sporulation